MYTKTHRKSQSNNDVNVCTVQAVCSLHLQSMNELELLYKILYSSRYHTRTFKCNYCSFSYFQTCKGSAESLKENIIKNVLQ